MKRYIVHWYTKENRQIIEHERTMEAKNAKEARKAFDSWWMEKESKATLHKPRHAFGVEVRLFRDE